MNQIIWTLLVWFVERQIKKWGKDLDWAKVKVDLVKRIRALVPGERFDDAAAFMVEVIVDLVEMYVKQGLTPELAAIQAKGDLDHELARRALAAKQGV